MTHGSLFSGIGGFDLAAEWMGWENKFHCEWNPFGQRVLKYYWPNAESFEDITKTDFTKYANRISVLTGGFPCQPYSLAGRRKGKDDERHLWPQMCRAIREIKPRWVVGENVYGLVNWNEGLVFHEVQVDLEASGYEVFPYVLPAASVGAPHKRERIWFVARHTSNSSVKGLEGDAGEGLQGGVLRSPRNDKDNTITNASNQGLQGESNKGEDRRTEGEWSDDGRRDATRIFRSTWEEFPTESPLCDGNDGLPKKLDGITFPKWRNQSIMAGGNAIVPQLALQIFKTIEQYESLCGS
jgi:DNA (cytosine-5)-methyltransferase 1